MDSDDLREELKIPVGYKVILSVAPDIMSERKGGKWILQLANRMRDKEIFFVIVGTI